MTDEFDFGNPKPIKYKVDEKIVLGLPYVREWITQEKDSIHCPLGEHLLAFQVSSGLCRLWSYDPTWRPHRPPTMFGLCCDSRTISRYAQSARWQDRSLGWHARKWLRAQRHFHWYQWVIE
jgi:hypothetical protein